MDIHRFLMIQQSEKEGEQRGITVKKALVAELAKLPAAECVRGRNASELE